MWVQPQAGHQDGGSIGRGTETVSGQGQALQPEQDGRKGAFLALPSFGSSEVFPDCPAPVWLNHSKSLAGPMVTEDWILPRALISNPQCPRERADAMASGWGLRGKKVGLDLWDQLLPLRAGAQHTAEARTRYRQSVDVFSLYKRVSGHKSRLADC